MRLKISHIVHVLVNKISPIGKFAGAFHVNTNLFNSILLSYFFSSEFHSFFFGDVKHAGKHLAGNSPSKTNQSIQSPLNYQPDAVGMPGISLFILFIIILYLKKNC